MSEILTAAQVADFWYPEDSIGDLKASHEALRANYDALLQGAAAQRVATLMDEADRLKEAFPADSVWDQHAVQCGNCEVWLIAKNSPLKANGFPSNGLSDTGKSEDEALCGMCAGAEMYRLMDEADQARVEISWLKEVHAENKGDITMLHNEADILRVEIERLKGDLELALRRIFNLEDITRIAELEKHLESVLTALGCQLAGVDGALKVIDAKNTAIAELEKERDAARISPLTDEDNDCHIDWWTAEMENLKNVAADWKGAVAGLNKSIEEWKASYTRVCAERDAATAERDGEKLGRQILAGALEQAVQNGKRCADERDGLRGECAAALRRETEIALERDGLRRTLTGALEWFDAVTSSIAVPPMPGPDRGWVDMALRALAAAPAPVAKQGKSHAHQWFKNGDYREDSMFGISCPVWACGSCKITCSATDKPSENL